MTKLKQKQTSKLCLEYSLLKNQKISTNVDQVYSFECYSFLTRQNHDTKHNFSQFCKLCKFLQSDVLKLFETSVNCKL